MRRSLRGLGLSWILRSHALRRTGVVTSQVNEQYDSWGYVPRLHRPRALKPRRLCLHALMALGLRAAAVFASLLCCSVCVRECGAELLRANSMRALASPPWHPSLLQRLAPPALTLQVVPLHSLRGLASSVRSSSWSVTWLTGLMRLLSRPAAIDAMRRSAARH